MTHELSGDLLVFFRAEGFYLVEAVEGISLTQQAIDHAELNPGTLRIEDTSGDVLWRPQ